MLTTKGLFPYEKRRERRKKDDNNQKAKCMVYGVSITISHDFPCLRIQSIDIIQALAYAVNDLVNILVVAERSAQATSQRLVTGSLLGGIIMKKTGKYFWLTFAAYGLLTVGVAIIFLSSGFAHHSTVEILIGMTIAAFGSGIGVTTTLIALSK
ncbi:hypothetical protein ACJ72_04260 [Emergomyces africanus]|uniref:Major facilitator superfamily (MFS) profile domain-containing protein n=1 Tax=Emergomyces africanus TaxID=1955775 RepID=A0A1B7NXA3_9EURO|nr:hypothetical protein ACJ72_04260 [Emergomyces africanus]